MPSGSQVGAHWMMAHKWATERENSKSANYHIYVRIWNNVELN